MPWIKTIEEADAEEDLARVYARIRNDRGKLSNIMQVQSLHPNTIEAHLDLYMATMFGKSGLSRQEREMIAVVVSAANRCDYCVRHHAAALATYWKDEARLERFIADYRSGEQSPKMMSVLVYADALTRTPDSVTEAHVHALRAHGLTDADILAVNLIIAYFNFVNRIAQGLGVEFTAEEAAGYHY